MKKQTLIFFLMLLTAFSFAQKKKTIKKYNIRSIVSTEQQNGKIVNDNKSFYNANGQLIEEINYDKDGKFKSDTKYKYNSDGDVIEESEYSEAKVLIEKRVIKYDVLGEKTEELVQNKDGKQIRRITYSYNAKGLKTEKKTFDANNTLISTKKIVYTYK